MIRKSDPLLKEFLDKSIPLTTIRCPQESWEVWDGYDEGIEGWVLVWYPIGDSKTGNSYCEFARAYWFKRSGTNPQGYESLAFVGQSYAEKAHCCVCPPAAVL